MKAVEASLLKFLQKSPQFVIPIYQRTYSWFENECSQLWDDIIRTGSNENVSSHFVGSIVYIEEGLYSVSSQSPLLVIDGQQRLTTILLLLEALARRLGKEEPIEGFSAKKLRHYYLLNHLEEGERGFKLLLTQTDKDSLLALMQQKSMPKEHSFRIQENFDFFVRKINALGDNLVPLCKGLAKLVIVDISLTRDQDNPQLIFESMNSTGKELSQADLIRNFILMGLEPTHQTHLYQEHWRPMEVDFGQEAYGSHFDRFMRDYLTIKTGELPNKNQVYESFKEYARLPEIAVAGVDALVADVHIFAGYYCCIVLGKETNRDLAEAFHDLRELKADVVYPLLLELYHDYRNGVLDRKDFLQAVRLIESYVFRRAICNIPTNSLNKTFVTFSRVLKKDRYLESIQAHLIKLPSYRRFPDDDEFKRELKVRDMYNFPRRSYWLRRMENFGRKERVPVAQYTIEHILPQNEDLSAAWRSDLGPEWRRIQETWLHTLGNLTLTGYNSEYSDRSFIEKRDMPGGFKQSPLMLNQGLGNVQVWNEEAIQERAAKLTPLAMKVWPSPSLPEEILEGYSKRLESPTSYSIEDHPSLSSSSPMRPLFEAFRKEVLALDPVVTEEFLKIYVAYKAETNFVDVVPLTGSLLLTLNMAIHDLIDPKGMSRDMRGIGCRGNGEVQIKLTLESDIPYVMGLVRQSFEKQMGNGETE